MKPIEMLNRLQTFQPEMIAIRRDFHTNPELGFEEVRTSDIVAAKLGELGVEVHRGIGKTGVVGVLKGMRIDSGRRIGLRADMDALPIQEENIFDYKSKNSGHMHGCGHDGHTTMLLGAARYLAETRNFNGTVFLYFQPGEEGYAGARAMIQNGLFDRFSPDAVFALHNWPSMEAGTIGVRTGEMMAAIDRFEVCITGVGGHGAHPHQAVDPILVGSHIVAALQSIVSRSVDPTESAVVSLQSFQAGSSKALSVIPPTAHLSGMTKWFKEETQEVIRERLTAVVHHCASVFGATAQLTYEPLYPPTVNSHTETELVVDVAERLVGKDKVFQNINPSMGSEDFAFMLRERPGAYFRLGQGGKAGCFLHSPRYDFNDSTIPVGSGMFVGIVETSMPL